MMKEFASDPAGVMPEYLSGQALQDALAVLPPYNPAIRDADMGTRIASLSALYNIYIPTEMSVEIYNKMYIALRNSLLKKNSRQCIAQGYENHGAVAQHHGKDSGENYYNSAMRQSTSSGAMRRGILGGSDSFSIIGSSGIGKTISIGQAVGLICGDGPVSLSHPFRKLIPVLSVQTPFDCSPKGMLLQILLSADELLGTSYHNHAVRSHATQDMLIGTVSQVCLNHVGLLIVDEIQNVVASRNGRSLVGMLTQLINASGTSICFVGTPEVGTFFEQTAYLARRTIGLHYGPMEYNDEFCHVCGTLLNYSYTGRGISSREALLGAAHEYSGGTISTVVSLLHDAQEIAILSGREILDLQAMDDAWKKRMGTMHESWHPRHDRVLPRLVSCRAEPKKDGKEIKTVSGESHENRADNVPAGAETTSSAMKFTSLLNLANQAQANGADFLELLSKNNLAEILPPPEVAP